jgi:ribosomal protein L29
MKNKTDYKALSTADLQKEVASNEQAIRSIKFSMQGVTNKNTKAIRDAKKTIARAKTALRAQLG